jgi:hypothetical protein
MNVLAKKEPKNGYLLLFASLGRQHSNLDVPPHFKPSFFSLNN